MPRRSRSPRRRSESPRRRSKETRRSRSREKRRSRSRSKPRRSKRSPSRSRSKPRNNGNTGRTSTETSKCIGVFGLSFRTTERDLEDEFAKFGELESVKLICHPLSKESRGFGFLTFRDLDSAVAAVDKCNGMMLHGRKVRVDFSMTKGPHQPTPGRYLGDRRSRSGSRSRSRSRSRSGSRKRERRSPKYD